MTEGIGRPFKEFGRSVLLSQKVPEYFYIRVIFDDDPCFGQSGVHPVQQNRALHRRSIDGGTGVDLFDRHFYKNAYYSFNLFLHIP
jgi:hypothetical protein